MGKYLGLHEKSYIGPTTEISTSGATASAELLATPGEIGPATFILVPSEDCYVRQGGSTVEAAATDFRLQKWQAVKIVVDSSANNYIAALQVSAGGTLKCTRFDSETP